MEYDVNSKEYWDLRFKGDWQENKGMEQTEFFGQIICEFLPLWLKAEISKNNYKIADMGCALGGAVKTISEGLGCIVEGYDFSDQAINRAITFYPKYKFSVLDLKHIPEYFDCDIAICSNVLEHFENPWAILNNIMGVTKKYVILLCPYKENPRLPEHFYVFNDEAIPLELSGFHLVNKNIINIPDKNPSFYDGMQILIVYKKDGL